MLSFIIILISAFTLIAIEFLYSNYKKDNIYSKNQLYENLKQGIFLMSISYALASLYFIFFENIFLFLGYSYSAFTFLSFVFCLLLVDMQYYFFHRIHHTYKILKHLHKVHHSDEHYNLSTSLRISIVEQTYIFLFLLPIIIIGFNPILVFACAFILISYQMLCHSAYINFPKTLEKILITPALHKNHHSTVKEEQNSNFGAIFSIWDKLFRTYTEPRKQKTFGLKVR